MPGMRDSSWATGHSGSSFRRGGNWNCFECGTSIPLSQRSCPQCNPSWNGTRILSSNTNSLDPLPLHSSRSAQPKNTPQTIHTSTPLPNTPSAFFSSEQTRNRNRPSAASNHGQLAAGLAMSRWAPRKGSRREVWTKTISKPSKPIPPTHQASHEPSLDLPYQVQHYILGMMQRILEEACYDHAARWIPKRLIEKGLDCAEAVELSNWKSFLPTAIPTHAITPLPNYSLAAALADAVHLRNRAVHRHLCDTKEIKIMALQCKDLMVMFSDTTRQEKFYLLWIALGHWEKDTRADPNAARVRLEEALRNISERPVDDMDWSPNALSLQEVSDDGEEEEFVDAMELD